MKEIRFLINIMLDFITTMGLLILILYACGVRVSVVMSGSMEPVIETGSIAFVDTTATYEDLIKNDIIAFSQGELRVLHRIVSVTDQGIETKGDNNNTSDGITTTSENFIGKYLCSISKIGFVIGTPKGRNFILIGIIALFSLSIVFNQIEKFLPN